MTWQPTSAQWPDVELWATGHLRAALAARPEPFAASVFVSNNKPATNRPRAVVVRRDGGSVRDLIDRARLTIRVWADDEREASDLARLVRSLMLAAPGDGTCTAVTHLSGPLGVPDESQPQKYISFDVALRPTSNL